MTTHRRIVLSCLALIVIGLGQVSGVAAVPPGPDLRAPRAAVFRLYGRVYNLSVHVVRVPPRVPGSARPEDNVIVQINAQDGRPVAFAEAPVISLRSGRKYASPRLSQVANADNTFVWYTSNLALPFATGERLTVSVRFRNGFRWATVVVRGVAVELGPQRR